ncbi:MAG: hypothetical protein ACRDV9_01645 [Acidimicrobiia bacterium]
MRAEWPLVGREAELRQLGALIAHQDWPAEIAARRAVLVFATEGPPATGGEAV